MRNSLNEEQTIIKPFVERNEKEKQIEKIISVVKSKRKREPDWMPQKYPINLFEDNKYGLRSKLPCEQKCYLMNKKVKINN